MERQSQLQRQIARFLDNFRKLGRKHHTPAIVRGRIRTLKELWQQFVDGHLVLERTVPEDTRASVSYFIEDVYGDTEDLYNAALDHMAEVLEEVEPPPSPARSVEFSHSRAVSSAFSLAHLPPIQLPPFDGRAVEWEQFRDRFTAVIIENKDLNDFARMHFLVSFLRGQALECLANLSITADNFSVAWRTLKDMFDNKRRLLSVHMSTLLSLPQISRESRSELQTLRGRVNMTIASLTNLGRTSAELWNDFLVHAVAQRLDSVTRKAWNLRSHDNDDPPSFEDLDQFLASRIRALEDYSTDSHGRSTDRTPTKSRVHVAAAVSSRSPCPLCKEPHFFSACSIFLRGDPSQRRELVKRHRRCFNCLSNNHSATECKSKYSCRKCHKRHHSLLHADSAPASPPAIEAPARSQSGGGESQPEALSLHAASIVRCRTPVLLATARIKVIASSGRTASVRALLDQGSELTFITENLAQLLRARRVQMPVSLSAIGCVRAGTYRRAVEVAVSPLSSSSPSFATTAIVLKSLTSYAPRRQIDESCLTKLPTPWADPDPLSNDPIDIIIGAELYGQLLLEGVCRGHVGQPVAQNTVFGWIMSGPMGQPETRVSAPRPRLAAHSSVDVASVSHCFASSSLDEDLKRFWEIEEVPRCPLGSPADDRCENHFKTTHSRSPDGRYTIRLPFKAGPPIAIGESRFRAAKCLASLSRRLQNNAEHRRAYCEFLREYETLGHMRRVPAYDADLGQVVFVPHHPVFRAHSTTTSLRVVFNASSPTSNGSSLNDHLLADPKLQTELPAVILRWRFFKYVYCADIAKMFRQIQVDERDRDFQRILWSESPQDEPAEFQLTTVTYGMVCAPFLALRVIQQLVVDEGSGFPLAVPILRDNIYVDDILFGGDHIEDARRARDQLISLLTRGGFELRKWSANSPSLLADIATENHGLACSKYLEADESLKILGIRWLPAEDAFGIGVSLPEQIPRSKRLILSAIAKFYDPLGWATPATIAAKVFIQQLWRRELRWDDSISDELFSRWRQIYEGLSSLDGIRVSRWSGYGSDLRHVEIHGFADASSVAYAAVVYCKIVSRSDEVTISLLAGKSKVAPLRPLSIPRLELSAAVVLARLIEFVTSSLALGDVSCYCWSDSTVVLTWLSQHPSRWKVFVANRVADIQSRVPGAQWRYVPTHDNPADCASRGLIGDELRTYALWWQGSLWLSLSEASWPPSLNLSAAEASLEEKRATVHVSTAPQTWDLFSRYSSWPKLIRVTAYIFRFVFACRHRKIANSDSATHGRAITASECSTARTFIVKWLQSTLFPKEIQILANGQSLPTRSPILSLSPFLDCEGIIRVGGRISRAPSPFARRHPILLSSHTLTKQIIDNAHIRALHAGIQLTLNIVRRDFWILRARGIVRQRIHSCVICARERAAVPSQLMSDLPRHRVSAPTRSFLHSGLDYAGPVLVRASAGRGTKSCKAYIALFICLATRAVHLELAADYSAQAFLNAFDRFTARRGLPTTMYSDNGTNFVGAAKELAAAYRAALLNGNFLNRTATDGITWKFIPPSAPHFGGIWEAGIKSVKHHLRRMLKDRTLTFEELSTLLCRVEACLNSRPIAPLSDSYDNYEPLTPGHFIIGSALTTAPEPSLLDAQENRLTRWQLVRRLTEQFWRFWYRDYVNTLQQRAKWRKMLPSIKVGQLVLLRNDHLPPCKWELGRVSRCLPGADGLTRVVTVRTASSEVTRPIVKLCLLPIDCEAKADSRVSEGST